MPDQNARQRLAAAISGYVEDGVALLGASLVTYGSYQVYHPAGSIVGGLFLLVPAWRAARRAARVGA